MCVYCNTRAKWRGERKGWWLSRERLNIVEFFPNPPKKRGGEEKCYDDNR